MAKPVIAELFIDHGTNDAHAIHVFVSEPSPLEEKNLGKVFAIFDFSEPQRFTEELVDVIDSNFSKAFYHSTEFDIEVAFERALQRVNKVVQEAITSYGEDWVYHTSAVLGVMRNQEVHFTYIGEMEAFLMQGESITNIIQHGTEDIRPLKLFSNIISGQCPIKGGLLFCTTNLLDYLSQEKIRRCITEQSPAEAIQSFENILTAQTTLSSIAGLIIKMTTAETSATVADVLGENDILEHSDFVPESHDSMKKLVHHEKTTNDLLTPSIWPSVKKQLHRFKQSPTTALPELNSSTTPGDGTWSKLQPWLKQAWSVTVKILIWLQRFLINLILATADFLGRLIKGQRSVAKSLGAAHGRFSNSWWERLTPARRLLLITFVIVALIFTITLWWKQRSVKEQTVADTSDKTLDQVDNLVGAAESKHIIPDDASAREDLTKANDLLKAIPSDTKIDQTRLKSIQDKIASLDNTLNKVRTVTAETVANYSEINSATKIGLLTKIGEYVYGFDTQQQSVYRINTTDNKGSAVLENSAVKAPFTAVVNDSAATTLISLANNDFVQFNPILEKATTVTIGKLPDKSTVADIDLFNSRLYILDPVHSQIYRAQKSGDAYGTPSEWIKDQIDLSQAISFDIDASIYVLLKSGEIVKFTEGKKTDLALETVSPNLAGATKLTKSSPTSKFYVFNPTTKRVVIFTADGKLDQQLTAPELEHLQDAVVDEDKQLVYFVADNTLYKISTAATETTQN